MNLCWNTTIRPKIYVIPFLCKLFLNIIVVVVAGVVEGRSMGDHFFKRIEASNRGASAGSTLGT